MNRGPGRRFERGRSGNPGGRPKVAQEVRDLARQHGAAAVEALAKILHDSPSEKSRIAAAVALLDRGYGKPPQEIQASAIEGPMTVEIVLPEKKP